MFVGYFRMRRSVVIAIAIPFACLASPVQAQDETDRMVLYNLGLQLAEMTEASPVRALELRGINRARNDRDNALLHLELGLIAYRLGELTGEYQHFENAASEFEWAAELQPDWPYPHYGRSISELALLGSERDMQGSNVRRVFGTDPAGAARNAALDALEIDPSFVPAVGALAAAFNAQSLARNEEEVLDAVRSAAATSAGDDPLLQLAMGRIERDKGDLDSAVAAFERMIELGGDASVANLEIARTELSRGNLEVGQDRYYAGIMPDMSDDALRLYIRDLSWISNDDELSEMPADRDALALWIREFWTRRDAIDARRPGDRLAEHYRRYVTARNRYRAVLTNSKDPFQYSGLNPRYIFSTEQNEFDDRGIIYIRHGEPQDEEYRGSRASWAYDSDTGRRVVHFREQAMRQYRLVDSDPNSRLSVLYGRPRITASMLQRQQNANLGIIAELATTDRFVQDFQTEIDAAWQVLAFDGPGDSVDVLIGVDAGRAGLETWAYGLSYDSSEVYQARSTSDPRVMLLRVPDAGYKVSAAFTTGSNRGDVWKTDSLNIYGPASRPNLSDLIVADSEVFFPWARSGGDTIAFSPELEFDLGSRVQLSYQVLGLEEGDTYDVLLEVLEEGGGVLSNFVRLFGRNNRALTLEFTDVASGPVSEVRQSLDLGELPVGRYEIRLRVWFEGGWEVIRRAHISVTD